MNTLKTVNLKNFGKKQSGKVRDFYTLGDKRILITTDRISAFDRILGIIPHKGAVLNLLSQFWFDKTKDIIKNHLIKVPDQNVMIVHNCKLIPIEMIVRGYMTGVTTTSIWSSYQKGERIIYGIKFPEGLKKNQKLSHPIITPTYHGDITGKGGHDTRLTKKEILKRKIVSKKIYEQMEKTALKLFKRGNTICLKAGIILVDTKYEFGLLNGKLTLIDEIHTPDSSRFWVRRTYQKQFKKGLEPENFDKEFVRLWFKERGYSGDGKRPKMTPRFVKKVSKRYKDIYSKITGKKLLVSKLPIKKRIEMNLKAMSLN